MTGIPAKELLALHKALSEFAGGSCRWGSIAANGVRFTLIPTEQVNALLDVRQEVQEALNSFEEAEGGAAE